MPSTHMRFTEHLAAHMIPEWRKQYISYETLKTVLNAEDSGGFYDEDSNGYRKPHRSINEEFFQRCEKELNKVILFYSEKISEAQRRLASFGVVAKDVSDPEAEVVGGHLENSEVLLLAYRGTTELKQLKMAVCELYLSLAFLLNYQELNYKGFCKIIKKYDTKFASEKGLRWRNEKLDTSPLNSDRRECQQLMSKLETFMCHLEGENKQKAMKRLEVPPIGTVQSVQAWIPFRIGVTCGLLVALLALIIIRVFQVPDWEYLKPLLRLYRGSFLLIEFLFLLGVNMYVWRKSGVNHILIFELDPRDHVSHHHVFEVAGGLAVCWCTSILVCLHEPLLPIPLQLQPLLFHSLLLLLLLNPTPTCQAQARCWILSLLCKVLTAPCHPVRFADCWLADQLNSLSPLFLGLWDLLCFYTCEINWRDLQSLSSPPVESLNCERYTKAVTCLIQCFPPWLRFAQCLRHFWDSGHTVHLLNAGKYSTVFLMVTFAGLYNMARERPSLVSEVKVYLYLWALATCISVLVTVSWDLRMDWGLLQGNGLLKENMVYPHQACYYGAMLADVLLRLSWAINIILAQMKDSATAACASSILIPLEVLRRFIWNLFRLENEHLKNCEWSRAVRDLHFPVAPLNPPGHFLLERMMDMDELAKDHDKKRTSRENSSYLTLKCLRTRVRETRLSMEGTEAEALRSV